MKLDFKVLGAQNLPFELWCQRDTGSMLDFYRSMCYHGRYQQEHQDSLPTSIFCWREDLN